MDEGIRFIEECLVSQLIMNLFVKLNIQEAKWSI